MALAHLSNDTVRFTVHMFTMALTFVPMSEFNLLKCSHFLNCFELLGNRKIYTCLYDYCVYNQLQNKNHLCQCNQMHRNYFRIITALFHLTAVLFCYQLWRRRGLEHRRRLLEVTVWARFTLPIFFPFPPFLLPHFLSVFAPDPPLIYLFSYIPYSGIHSPPVFHSPSETPAQLMNEYFSRFATVQLSIVLFLV